MKQHFWAIVLFLVLFLGISQPILAYDVYIDASIGTPVVSTPWDQGSWLTLFGPPTVTPIIDAAWSLTFIMPGRWISWGDSNRGLEITDPATGQLVDSFGVDYVQWSDLLDQTTVFAELYCIDSSGNISGRPPRISNAPVATAVETGDFQLAMHNMQTEWATVDVYLKVTNPKKSIPIPPTAWLLGSGLIGLVGFRKKFLA